LWTPLIPPVDFNLTGLSRGGQQVQKSRDTYVKAVGTLVELASLQVSRARHDDATMRDHDDRDDHDDRSDATVATVLAVLMISSRADAVELMRRGMCFVTSR
jgi:hypothetical protein